MIAIRRTYEYFLYVMFNKIFQEIFSGLAIIVLPVNKYFKLKIHLQPSN